MHTISQPASISAELTPSSPSHEPKVKAALTELVRLGRADTEQSVALIQRMLARLAQKNPYEAIEQAMSAGIDLGDAYVVLACLVEQNK